MFQISIFSVCNFKFQMDLLKGCTGVIFYFYIIQEQKHNKLWLVVSGSGSALSLFNLHHYARHQVSCLYFFNKYLLLHIIQSFFLHVMPQNIIIWEYLKNIPYNVFWKDLIFNRVFTSEMFSFLSDGKRKTSL